MNMELVDSLGFPEKMDSRELIRVTGMQTDVPLAKAHLCFSLLPQGCFWLGTPSVLESASKKNKFRVHHIYLLVNTCSG